QYDDLPSFPKVNIHFLATASGNEHLLKFMTEKPDNPIRFKGKRIGIIATRGVEETEVTIPRKWFEARGAICHLVSPNHVEYAPTFGARFPEIANTDLRKFLDRNVSFTSAPRFDSRHHYRADEAGAQATAQSERTRAWLVANRFQAVSQASMTSARLANIELASQWLRR